MKTIRSAAAATQFGAPKSIESRWNKKRKANSDAAEHHLRPAIRDDVCINAAEQLQKTVGTTNESAPSSEVVSSSPSPGILHRVRPDA